MVCVFGGSTRVERILEFSVPAERHVPVGVVHPIPHHARISGVGFRIFLILLIRPAPIFSSITTGSLTRDRSSGACSSRVTTAYCFVTTTTLSDEADNLRVFALRFFPNLLLAHTRVVGRPDQVVVNEGPVVRPQGVRGLRVQARQQRALLQVFRNAHVPAVEPVRRLLLQKPSTTIFSPPLKHTNYNIHILYRNTAQCAQTQPNMPHCYSVVTDDKIFVLTPVSGNYC